MNPMSRNVAAAALSVAVALGAAAPAAAGPHGDKAAGKADKVAAKAVKKEGKVAKADRVSGKDRALAKRAERKAAYLDRLADSAKVARLGEHAATVAVNIVDDRDLLEEAAAALRDRLADADDRTAARGMRPEVYQRIIAQVRQVTDLLDAAADAPADTTPVEDPATTEPAPEGETPVATTDAATLDAAQVAELEALLAELLTYDATTPRSALKAAQAVITGAEESLDEADEADEADDTDDTEAPAAS
jgi:hypothetical protein